MKPKKNKKYKYQIIYQDYVENDNYCMLTFQDMNTLAKKKIPIHQLVNDLDLLYKFRPEDIFMVGYITALASDAIHAKRKSVLNSNNSFRLK